MRLSPKTIKIAAFLAFLLLTVLIAFLARPPVLVVTDLSFAGFYGIKRQKKETALSSFILFRRVMPVTVADDAGDDIIQAAVQRASSKPLCVLFPLRFAKVAGSYREKKPDIPVVLLEGRYTEDENPAAFAISGNLEDYFIYKTNIYADYYRAGLAAAAINGEKNEKIAIFLEPNIQIQAKEAISIAQKDTGKPLQTSFFTDYSQFSGNQGISCVIMSGNGVEYFEKYSGIPVIFFTWINPELIPADVVLIFNDSPWVQAVSAVRMVQAGIKNGQIPSKILLAGKNGLGKGVVRKLRKI